MEKLTKSQKKNQKRRAKKRQSVERTERDACSKCGCTSYNSATAAEEHCLCFSNFEVVEEDSWECSECLYDFVVVPNDAHFDDIGGCTQFSLRADAESFAKFGQTVVDGRYNKYAVIKRQDVPKCQWCGKLTFKTEECAEYFASHTSNASLWAYCSFDCGDVWHLSSSTPRY
jgi:hypothetical protein